MASSRQHTTRTVNTNPEALADNPAYQTDMAATMAAVVPEGYVEEQVTFPPYWKPDVAKGWRGTVIARDEREVKFPRYIIESAITIDCRTGKVTDGEIVTVTPGMNFSISAYKALPLDRYFGLEVAVICTALRTGMAPTEESEGMPRDMWVWKMLVHPDVKKLLDSRKKEDMAFLREAQRIAGRKHLEELARSQAEGRATRLSAL